GLCWAFDIKHRWPFFSSASGHACVRPCSLPASKNLASSGYRRKAIEDAVHQFAASGQDPPEEPRLVCSKPSIEAVSTARIVVVWKSWPCGRSSFCAQQSRLDERMF